MQLIDYTVLRELVPHYRARLGNTRGVEQEHVLFWLSIYLDSTLNRWGIDTLLRKAHFLGQSSVESRDYTSMYEDKNDHSPVSGQHYEHKHDLGNTHPGDGATYIGRGMLQLTGRSNYETYGDAVDTWHEEHDNLEEPNYASPMCLSRRLDLTHHPQRASDFPAAIETACAYWIGRHINRYADKDDAEGVTHCINSALLELGKREQRTEKAKTLLYAAEAAEAFRSPS